MFTILLTVLLGGSLAAGQARGSTGSIVGCVMDQINQPLPGTEVIARSRGGNQTATTGSSGCYELALAPGSYRVTAVLAGFDHITRDHVSVTESKSTHVDFTMPVSAICECLELDLDLKGHVDYADAIARVRLSDAQPKSSNPRGHFRHRATILDAIKLPSGTSRQEIHILQNQRSGTPLPYDIGQELVVFLKSMQSGEPGDFFIVKDEPGLVFKPSAEWIAMAFLVEHDRISHSAAEFTQFIGSPVRSLWEELQRLSRAKVK